MKLPESYLLARRKRWYQQEKRKPAPFMLPCVLRIEEGMAPRFIQNKSRCIATNSYLLLYPKESLQRIMGTDSSFRDQIHNQLRQIGRSSFEKEGRLYGGGLIKIEPKELGKVTWHPPTPKPLPEDSISS